MSGHDFKILADIEEIQHRRAELLGGIDGRLDLLADSEQMLLRIELSDILDQLDIVEHDLRSLLSTYRNP
jgi:hypothetical protein